MSLWASFVWIDPLGGVWRAIKPQLKSGATCPTHTNGLKNHPNEAQSDIEGSIYCLAGFGPRWRGIRAHTLRIETNSEGCAHSG